MSFLFHRMLNRLRPRPLYSAAVAREILHPGEENPSKPSLHLPGDFENILAVISASTLEAERTRTFGGRHFHLPTIRYEFANARLSGPYLTTAGRIANYPTNRPTSGGAQPGRIKEALLSTNVLSGLEFGHWVRDSLVSELQGQRMGLPAIGMAREPWEHEPAYRAMTELDCTYVREATVDRLVLLDDRGLNAHWGERFLTLRDRLKTKVDTVMPSAGRRVFLDRGGQSRPRDPVNLPAVREALEALGFQTVTAIDLPLPELQAALRDVELVVSAEGSHLNHLHYMAADGITLLTLQDPRRFYSFHKSMVDFYGTNFGFLIGRPDPDTPDRFYIDIDDLKRLIDLAR